MFPIACVRLRTGYNEAGVIVPHKTEVAIALWRIAVSIANMFNNSTQPRCSSASGLFLALYPSFLCSTAYLSVNYSHREKISRFLFGGSGFSSYLCQRLTDDSSLSGRATVSPMASCRRLFLCLIGKNIFPNWENIFS